MITKQAFGANRGDELYMWDVHRLWELTRDLQVESVPLDKFQPVLEARRCRFWTEERPNPTFREVAEYARRIHQADLTYPIILSAEGEVMDGMHRLAKAWMLGTETIRVVRFPVTPDPDERRPV